MNQKIPKEKKQTILDTIDSGKSVGDVAEEYSVSTKTIYGWISNRRGPGDPTRAQWRKATQENELLKALVGTLVLEKMTKKKD